MPGIRSYNAFLRSAKSQLGLQHRAAQALYRRMAERLGSKPSRLSLRQHPRITKQEVSKVLRQPKAPKRAPTGKRPKAPTEPVRTVLKEHLVRKAIRSIEEYLDLLDEPFDVEIIGAGVDTGRSKKK